jgi:hypothetical protein
LCTHTLGERSEAELSPNVCVRKFRGLIQSHWIQPLAPFCGGGTAIPCNIIIVSHVIGTIVWGTEK